MLNIHVNIVRRLFIIYKPLSKAHNLVRIYTERKQKKTYLVMSSRIKITNTVFLSMYPENTRKCLIQLGNLKQPQNKTKITAAAANGTTH